MKKIAFIIPNLLSGGTERMASRLSVSLSQYYDIYLIVFDASRHDYEFGGTLIDLGLVSKPGLINKIFNIKKRVAAVKKIVTENDIKTVIGFTSSADIVLWLLKCNVRKIVSCRGFEYLNSHHRLYRRMEKGKCEILFNSKAMQQFYLKKYPDMRKKTHVIYNIFDTVSIRQLSEEPLNEEERIFFNTHLTVTTMSHFSLAKGQWNLLKAFALLKKEVPNAGLVFIGYRGELENEIIEMARGSGFLEDILFAGFQKNPFKYLSKTNAYALCSVSEGFPNALVEAMICSAPIVSVNCQTGPKEILYHNLTDDSDGDIIAFADYGLLLPEMPKELDFDYNCLTSEHSLFADALKRMLTDQSLNTEYKNKAALRGNDFSTENIIAQYVKCFE